MVKRPKIVLVGAGNVGYHLGQRLSDCQLPIIQLFSRSRKKAIRLSKIIEVPYTTRLQRIDTTADIYVLAVQDDAIPEVAQSLAQILPADKVLVHTSGATPLSALGNYFHNTGIFYPLQTFSIERQVDFEQLPLCIFSQQKPVLTLLERLAQTICPNVFVIDDRQRAALHVAAVFVNNFSNHLFSIGEQISVASQVPFELLKPLIRETVEKIDHHSPREMQTGPAIRGDMQTIRQHLKLLKDQGLFGEIYKLLTKSINPDLKINK